MIHTIDQIRERISKLLLDIENLKGELRKEKENHEDTSRSLAELLIQQKDTLEEQIAVNGGIPSKDQQVHIQHLDTSLSKLDVSVLTDPLDTLVDFIHIVDTVKDANRMNGRVVKVVKRGYLKNDELLRPTHVIVVKND